LGEVIQGILESCGTQVTVLCTVQLGTTENHYSAVPHGMRNDAFEMPVYRHTIGFVADDGEILCTDIIEEQYWYGGYHSGSQRADTRVYRDVLHNRLQRRRRHYECLLSDAEIVS